MNDGVALLLDRMKTHPDEFVDGGKWAHIMNKHEDFLEAKDRQALTNGLNKLMQQRFTEKVLEELVEPKKSNLQQLRDANAKAAAEQMKSLRLNTVHNGGAVSGTITVNTPIAGVTQTL